MEPWTWRALPSSVEENTVFLCPKIFRLARLLLNSLSHFALGDL